MAASSQHKGTMWRLATPACSPRLPAESAPLTKSDTLQTSVFSSDGGRAARLGGYNRPFEFALIVEAAKRQVDFGKLVSLSVYRIP